MDRMQSDAAESAELELKFARETQDELMNDALTVEVEEGVEEDPVAC